VLGEGERAALLELAGRYRLSPGQGQQLQALLSMLAHDRHAPTSPRAREHALEAHIADSLVALELEAVRGADSLADLGSGAGFPGLPLAIALARSEVSLLESQARRCAFLERAVSEAGVANAHVVCSRAEEWSAGLGRHDVALARALGPQQVVVEYAAPLLRRGGVLVDWRGRRAREEERKAALAAQQLGLEGPEVREVAPFVGARDRHLHLYLKVSDTPPGFPRRVGVARKRPLGGRNSALLSIR
jgi:16S rRNA (guanine527-N7)-methyltransferase